MPCGLRALLRNPSGLIGLVLIAIPVTLVLARRRPGCCPTTRPTQDAPNRLLGPSWEHWFGTDQFGRDIFSRVAGGVANSARIAARRGGAARP